VPDQLTTSSRSSSSSTAAAAGIEQINQAIVRVSAMRRDDARVSAGKAPPGRPAAARRKQLTAVPAGVQASDCESFRSRQGAPAALGLQQRCHPAHTLIQSKGTQHKI